MTSYYYATIVVACLIAIVSCAPLDDVFIDSPDADIDYRLPETILPESYEITLRPYLLESDGTKRFTFDGEVNIEIVPSSATSQIILHAKNLVFQEQKITDINTPTTTLNISSALPTPDSTTDKITLTTSSQLTANRKYSLYFKYTGTMDDDMHGFYKSSYTDKHNNTKWLASTQFQTHHARRAFPSFDEPLFKAVFNVIITRHKSMKTVGNTRIMASTLNGDYITDAFQPTAKMSTYLLAFIVSEFNENYDGDFGILARPEYYDQTDYSYTVGKDILKSLGNYLNKDYYSMGVDKMHMAAIPDFSAGAMENWGLLTYRERSLLYDDAYTSLSSQQSIAAVIAHEQAHMWFGDYVTCKWWSYTWLNEGFARYFQYFGTAMVEKDWDLEKQFVTAQVQSVMNMDSTNNTNPMSDENTNSPSDLSRMFNSISYNKGASFIRMIKHLIGEENFQKSLQSYLTDNGSKNTVPQNLLNSWLAFWPNDTKTYAEAIFKGFTEQVGYPVINVEVSTDRRTMKLKQKRFLLKDNDGADASLLYTVPITYTMSSESNFNLTTPKLILTASTQETSVPLNSEVTWVIANIQETGYYRVNYDNDTWNHISNALQSSNWGNIHELNRAQIVDDLFNFARSGLKDYNSTLEIIDFLKNERNYLPWTSAFNGFSYLAIRLGTDIDDFSWYIRELLYNVYEILDFYERESDTALDIYNRANVISWYCKYGDSGCISKAKSLFSFMDQQAVPKNIASAVYCIAMREGNEDDYNKLFQKYKTTTVATEETNIVTNLGCVKDQKLVEKHFFVVISDDVRRQDKSSALSTLYTSNNENVSPVFKLVTENYEKLATAMGGYSAVATVISNIASRFTEESQLTDLRNFNTNYGSKFGSSVSTIEAAVKTVEENLKWDNEKLPTIRDFLKEYRSGAATTASMFTVVSLLLVTLISILI